MSIVLKLEAGGEAFAPDAQSALQQLSDAERQACTIVLDGTDVSLWRIDVPSLPYQKLDRILPSLCEDLIADDLAHHHLVLLGVDNNSALVAAVSNLVMDRAVACAASNGISAKMIVPETMCLRVPDEGAAVLVDGDFVCVRLFDGTGYKVPTGILDTVLAHDVARSDAIITPPDGDFTLATGQFAPSVPLALWAGYFKRSIMMFLLFVVAWAGVRTYQISALEAARDRHDAIAVAAFQKAYPDVRRIVNIEAQARAKAGAAAGAGSASFLALFNLLSEPVAAKPGLNLETLQYDAEDGSILVTIGHARFEDADRYLDALNRGGLVGQTGNSRQADGRIFTDITVRMAP